MAIDTESTSQSYQGNGSTVLPYFITFPFLEDDDFIQVEVTDYEGDITVLGAGDFEVHDAAEEAPYITTTDAIASTSTIRIHRRLPLTQPVVLPDTGRFPTGTVEEMMDRQTMLIQQVAADVLSHDHDSRYFTMAEVLALIDAIDPAAEPRLFMTDLLATGTTYIENPPVRIDGEVGVWRVRQGGEGANAVVLGDQFVLPVSFGTELPWSIDVDLVDLLTARYRATSGKWDVLSFIPGYPA